MKKNKINKNTVGGIGFIWTLNKHHVLECLSTYKIPPKFNSI